MRLPWRTGGITPDGANLLESAIGFIQTMLTLDDQRVGERQVSMQKDLLVWREFKNQIDELLSHIDGEHGKDEVLEIRKFVPSNITIIELISRSLRSGECCHVLSPYTQSGY